MAIAERREVASSLTEQPNTVKQTFRKQKVQQKRKVIAVKNCQPADYIVRKTAEIEGRQQTLP